MVKLGVDELALRGFFNSFSGTRFLCCCEGDLDLSLLDGFSLTGGIKLDFNVGGFTYDLFRLDILDWLLTGLGSNSAVKGFFLTYLDFFPI